MIKRSFIAILLAMCLSAQNQTTVAPGSSTTVTVINVPGPTGPPGPNGLPGPPNACSVAAWGALGTQVHDDTVNINMATSLCYDVYFPSPSVCYKTTGPILGKSGTRLQGGSGPGTNGGARICATGTGPAFSATAATNGARNIVIDNMYFEDDLVGRTLGDGIVIDGTGDAATFDIVDTHTYGFVNGLTAKFLLYSTVSRSRFDVPQVNGINQSGSSTSLTLTSTYVDAPKQDCYSLQGLVYSALNGTACDHSGRDAYHMVDATVNTITFNSAGTEAAGRYGFYVEGRGHVFNGTSCYVVDAVGNRCFYFDNVAQIVVNSGATRNGDYAYYYNGGPFATTFAGYPIVTILGAGNYIAGVHKAAMLFDPTGVVQFPDIAAATVARMKLP